MAALAPTECAAAEMCAVASEEWERTLAERNDVNRQACGAESIDRDRIMLPPSFLYAVIGFGVLIGSSTSLWGFVVRLVV